MEPRYHENCHVHLPKAAFRRNLSQHIVVSWWTATLVCYFPGLHEQTCCQLLSFPSSRDRLRPQVCLTVTLTCGSHFFCPAVLQLQWQLTGYTLQHVHSVHVRSVTQVTWDSSSIIYLYL